MTISHYCAIMAAVFIAPKLGSFGAYLLSAIFLSMGVFVEFVN